MARMEKIGPTGGLPAVTAIGILAAFSLLPFSPKPREEERFFMPGRLGYEPGLLATAPGPAAFLTRHLHDVDGEWARANHLTEPLAFSHNLAAVFPPELHSSHPEFFPLLGKERLRPPLKHRFFWNPDIAREDAAERAAEFASRHFFSRPDSLSFALGINDGLIWGESPELLALALPQRWFRERPDYTRLVYTFLNRTAERLEKTHPQKYLGALAYSWTEQAPDFPVHPQVIPFLTADRAQGYSEGFQTEERALQQRWIAAVRAGREHYAGRASGPLPPFRAGIYDYNFGAGFLVPRIYTRLQSEHLAYAARLGFTDYFGEATPNWGLDGPMPWLTAQLLSDPTRPVDGLLEEYYARCFGPAAGPMRRFFERCERQWMTQAGPTYWLKHYRNESQAGVFPSAVCGELRGMLDEARGLAQRSGRFLARVEFVGAAFGVTERFVAFSEARSALIGSVLSAPGSAEELVEALARYLESRRAFVGYTQALIRSDPLAPRPVDWADFLANDPTALALLAIKERAGAEGGERVLTRLLRAPVSLPRMEALWPRIKLTGEDSVALNYRPGTGLGIEMLRGAALSENVEPARTIAGLAYGVALPSPWLSQVEPAQYHRAELSPGDGARRLRISGSRDTAIFQWSPVMHGALHVASLSVRGKISSSCAVTVGIAWMDDQQRRLGFRNVRMPAGEWPMEVVLRQADVPPEGAAWVGWGLRVTNQMADDYVELSGFSLRGY